MSSQPMSLQPMSPQPNPQTVLTFWFQELTPKQWWQVDAGLDQEIGERFANLHVQASTCELSDWRDTAEGRLAEIIILDQFSRNIFRNTPKAFAQDPMALCLAQEAVRQHCLTSLPSQQSVFLLMPYMHSESKTIHEQALDLFAKLGKEENLQFEQRHKAIIDRFGRYPHRNDILGRTSTPEEIEFLKQPGSHF